MARILTFTSSPKDWQALLADPVKHWRTGYSARTLAHCWEAADGFPSEVAKALQQTDEAALQELTPVLAIPEFQVPLPPGGHPSQNDLFVLARSAKGPVCIMVEGKVSEPFGNLIYKEIARAQARKATTRLPARVKALLQLLFGHPCNPLEKPWSHMRYQILHRAASAVITGEQFRATAAVMLVHSFSEQRVGWSDYKLFADLFGVHAKEGVVQRLSSDLRVPLFGVWVVGDRRFLRS